MYSTKRYIIFSFLAATFLLWITLSKLFRLVTDLADLGDPALIGNQFTATTLAGLVVAVVTGVLVYIRPDVQRFCRDVVEELMKVAWPDWKATRSATGVVIITTCVVAAMLGVFDNVWRFLTGIIYSN